MKALSKIRFAGPLTPFAKGYAAELKRQGYTPLSAAVQLRLLAHLSRWLASERLGVDELCMDTVERYLIARRSAGYTGHLTETSAAPFP